MSNENKNMSIIEELKDGCQIYYLFSVAFGSSLVNLEDISFDLVP